MKNITAGGYLGSASELVRHIDCALNSIKALEPINNKELKNLKKTLTESLQIATKNKLALLEQAKSESVYP